MQWCQRLDADYGVDPWRRDTSYSYFFKVDGSFGVWAFRNSIVLLRMGCSLVLVSEL